MSSIDIMVPVYNEEKCLAENIEKLRQFLIESMSSYDYRIVIVDSGSIDGTLAQARALSTLHPEVTLMHLDVKGRGYALREAWRKSSADIVSYMDVDLSTELSDFPRLVSAIAQDGYDIAIGSRLISGCRVKRSFKRTSLSRSYNLLIRAMFRTTFRDAQCGFKALRREVTDKLIPLVKDEAWFFDTELLILAEKRGYRIKEIPVTWTEDVTSTVNIPQTVAQDIRGLVRLRRSL